MENKVGFLSFATRPTLHIVDTIIDLIKHDLGLRLILFWGKDPTIVEHPNTQPPPIHIRS